MTEQTYPTTSAGALIFDSKHNVFLMRSHKWKDKNQMPVWIFMTSSFSVSRSRFSMRHINRHMIFLEYAARADSTDVQLNAEAQEYV